MTAQAAWKQGLYEWRCRVRRSSKNGNRAGYIFCVNGTQHYVPTGQVEEFCDGLKAGIVKDYGHWNRLIAKHSRAKGD